MPVRLKALSLRQHELLEGMARDHYLEAESLAFAVALHRGLGWQLCAVPEEDNPFRHIFVQRTRKQYFDVRGPLSSRQIAEPYGLRVPLGITKYSEEELLSAMNAKIDEKKVEAALRYAQALWPDLPWKEGTPLEDARRFLEDLEGLCRRHKLSIRASSIGLVVCQSDDSEDGYELLPTIGEFVYAFKSVSRQKQRAGP